ncbi:OmpA family protein [Halovivax gelatinilyticus]|uniref:OmpA family protein n=1 Tax=Halovivax gelatinilyticus TaxID=2961597 RepID=UPI0020CA9A64|nr:OmpA family protein [Halovivax gelatinilyticus]
MSAGRSRERAVEEPKRRALADNATGPVEGITNFAQERHERALERADDGIDETDCAIGRPTHEDLRRTRSWAISADFSADVSWRGPGIGAEIFELVNRETGRAHEIRMIPLGVGFDISPIGLSSGPPNYTLFRTDEPVNFTDFHGVGARVTGMRALVGSVTYLTLWGDMAYFSDRLAYVRMSGWGLNTAGPSLAHGVTRLCYGDGEPTGLVPRVLNLPPRDPPRPPREPHFRVPAMEDERIDVPNDVLFAFDSAELSSGADDTLTHLADLLNNRLRKPVDIEGHTDSIGDPDYNMDLSIRRAEAVKAWFVDDEVYGAEAFTVRGKGETDPVAPNTHDDGSDNPEGRAKNRRVTIRAVWNV